MLKKTPKLTLSIKELAATLGIGEQTIRNGISKNTLPIRHVKFGDRVLFPVREIEAFLAGKQATSMRGHPRGAA